MLEPHPSAALEYWFFKVNAGPIALLVDWIEKRKAGERVLRVSVHAPGRHEVLFERLEPPAPGGKTFLRAGRTEGQIGSISWALDIAAGEDWIAPDIFPARLLKMPDLALMSAPLATFSGSIWWGDQTAELRGAPGVVSQYWGRQLLPEWWWISASQLDQPGMAVECAVLKSALWGSAIRMPLAYVYLREPGEPGRRQLDVVPLNLASVTGTPERFEIRVRRPGKPAITLTGAGRDYNDLGDGILNTLVGDLEVREGDRVVGKAAGTAGVERRAAG